MSNTIIKPSIGRVVWFYPSADTSGQAQAALVTFVHGDRMINVAGFNHHGTPFSQNSCSLVQDGDPEPASLHARWMPYQLGQAAKTEKAEAAVKAVPAVTDTAIEQEIQAKGLTAPRITPGDIEANIASEHYFTAGNRVDGGIGAGYKYPGPLDLLTFCVLVLKNGFTVTGESACASPENFDAEIGKKIARQNAVQKIWPLMGYQLREELHRRAVFDAMPKTGCGPTE